MYCLQAGHIVICFERPGVGVDEFAAFLPDGLQGNERRDRLPSGLFLEFTPGGQ